MMCAEQMDPFSRPTEFQLTEKLSDGHPVFKKLSEANLVRAADTLLGSGNRRQVITKTSSEVKATFLYCNGRGLDCLFHHCRTRSTSSRFAVAKADDFQVGKLRIERGLKSKRLGPFPVAGKQPPAAVAPISAASA